MNIDGFVTPPTSEHDFYRQECATWGEDEVNRLMELGCVIVPDGAGGFKWGLDNDSPVCNNPIALLSP